MGYQKPEVIKDRLRERGFLLLSPYTRISDAHTLSCIARGHILNYPLINVLFKGHSCHRCTEEQLREAVDRHHGVIQSTYTLMNRRMKFRCCHGHEFYLTPDSVLKGRWCTGRSHVIAKKIDDFSSIMGFRAITHDEDILTTSDSVLWECPSGHFFVKTWSQITSSWVSNQEPHRICPHCMAEFKMERYREIIQQRGGECLQEEYITGQNITIKCLECERIFELRADGLLKGRWCPYCRATPYENKCREIFEVLFGREFSAVWPDWLINPRTGYKLQLDGYQEEIGIAFEFQGRHHYSATDFPNGVSDPQYQKYKDKIKSKLCEENGVVLIAIPNSEKDDLFRFIITECKKRDLLTTRGMQ